MKKRYAVPLTDGDDEYIKEFPESEWVKKSDGKMYQCIGRETYDNMCQPFDHWIEHPKVVYPTGDVIQHCPGCLLSQHYCPEARDNPMDWSKGDLPKKKYQVSGTVTFNTAMSEIEAVSEEHAKEIFLRNWNVELGEPYLELDEDNLSVEEE
tara:strand:- start:556 stop:1011 length:456 start_codon:yes stop_codon:yes gene_type:complete